MKNIKQVYVQTQMKDIAICSPEIYTSTVMQEYIKQRREDEDKQWIHKLIAGESMENELVYVESEEWMICRDLHPGSDMRYLVVFKDEKLRTIRDLREEHIPLLKDVMQSVQEFLAREQPKRGHLYKVFFHYTPSVFQLHAHVSVPAAQMQNTRVQPMALVIDRLGKRSTWFRDALILISLCRSMKALHLYKAVKCQV